MRRTHGQTGSRRSHHALHDINVVHDKESKSLRLPHHLDEATGMYRGKQIFSPRVKRAQESKTKGPDTKPAKEHTHEHAHAEHANAESKVSKETSKKVVSGSPRPKARSGFGGGV